MPPWSRRPCPGESMSTTSRVDEHHVLRAGNGLRIDIDAAGVGVPLVDLMLRAVGVHRPEVVERHLAAVHVLPAHVEDAPVGQHPGRVVVLGVRGDHADAGAVGLHAVERGHLRHPAVHPPAATRRDEHDVAVRQPRGLEVVIFAKRELTEVRAVGVDRVEVVGAGAARTVREEDRLSVVVHDRIAHAAGRIDEQRAELAGLEVVGEETPFRAVGGRVR